MMNLSKQHRDKLIFLGQALIDQKRARIIVTSTQKGYGFGFGGGNVIRTQDGAFYLCGRYRNAGDSRTGIEADTAEALDPTQTVRILCTQPFTWSSSNSAYTIRPKGSISFGPGNYEFFPRGFTWEVALTRNMDRRSSGRGVIPAKSSAAWPSQQSNTSPTLRVCL